MTILRKRFHDLENNIFATEACLHIIEDTLNAVKEKKEELDVNSLSLKIVNAVSRLEDVEKELRIVKEIVYKKCNPNDDLDHLIPKSSYE